MSLATTNFTRFDGWCLTKGIHPESLAPHRFCNLVETWATQNMDEKQLDKFNGQLWLPPEGVEATSGVWSPEAEMAAFEKLYS